jgi:predicted nucleotidyltransferase
MATMPNLIIKQLPSSTHRIKWFDSTSSFTQNGARVHFKNHSSRVRMFLSNLEIKEVSVTISKLFPASQGAYLFGSVVNGDFTPESDVDIGILSEEPLDVECVIRLKGYISHALRRDCDVVDLRRADSITASQVVALGEAIVRHDPLALANFEVYAMSRYVYFNKECEAILLDIQKFGTIYGR